MLSLDSTMKSNVTVGPPIDLLAYSIDELDITRRRRFREDDADSERSASCWYKQALRQAASPSRHPLPQARRRRAIPRHTHPASRSAPKRSRSFKSNIFRISAGAGENSLFNSRWAEAAVFTLLSLERPGLPPPAIKGLPIPPSPRAPECRQPRGNVVEHPIHHHAGHRHVKPQRQRDAAHVQVLQPPTLRVRNKVMKISGRIATARIVCVVRIVR